MRCDEHVDEGAMCRCCCCLVVVQLSADHLEEGTDQFEEGEEETGSEEEDSQASSPEETDSSGMDSRLSSLSCSPSLPCLHWRYSRMNVRHRRVVVVIS